MNLVILVGRLGKDPDIKYTPSGSQVTSFNLATDKSWKDKSGEKVKKTEWHNITAFGKLAEICGNYLGKGKLVFIEGRIQTRQWDDKDGVKRYTTEIVASEMKMLDKKEAYDENEQAHRETAQSNYQGAQTEEDVPF